LPSVRKEKLIVMALCKEGKAKCNDPKKKAKLNIIATARKSEPNVKAFGKEVRSKA
jgi:hypothetical protein